MRAHEAAVDATAMPVDGLNDPLVDLQSGFERYQASADRRLVGDNDDLVWAGVNTGKCFQGLRVEAHVFPTADIVWTVFDDDAISIEEKSRVHTGNYTQRSCLPLEIIFGSLGIAVEVPGFGGV